MTVMNIVDLTILAFGVNAAVDSGKYSNITKAFVGTKIEDGTIFEFLENEVGADISLLTDEKRQELIEHWQSLNNVADSKGKFGVDQNGLCLILAYILEGIQNGTDIHSGKLPRPLRP